MFLSMSVVPVPEEYGQDSEKPKKMRVPPREIKHKKSKNSQEERWASGIFHKDSPGRFSHGH